MFLLARCLHSLAAVTPAEYELDIIQVTTVLIIRKKWENNGTEKIGLVTPTPGSDHTKLYRGHISQKVYELMILFLWNFYFLIFIPMIQWDKNFTQLCWHFMIQSQIEILRGA